MATLAAEDMPRFLEAAAKSDYFGLFLTAVYTGARFGELLALQWRNVDFENSTMMIVATLYRTGSTWTLKEPKSARSKRHVVLPTAWCRTSVSTKSTCRRSGRQWTTY